ncbi:MAG TPA: CBS domain-containing protein [Pseudonocardiaceae bacterium]
MPTATKVFASALTRLAVFGPDGEPVGRVRDLVATLRLGPEPPRVLGLVVELATRRRIFVPMLRVTAVDPGAVTLATGSVNLRSFSKRPNEVLVVGELLDARVRVRESGAQAAVVDIAMEQTRTRDWVLAKVALRERTGRLTRRGPVQVLSWDAVEGLTQGAQEHGPQSAQHLLTLFETMRAADVASALRQLPPKRRYEVADALDDERLADVIEELPDADQTDLLNHLAAERAADVLEAMNPDDAADVLAELPGPDAEQLLRLMEPQESAPVRRLMAYSGDTAGGLMTPEPVILAPDATVAEALARIRNPDLTPALASMVFVTRPPYDTPTGRYVGCVHAQRLLREPPFDLVAGAIDAELASLRPGARLPEVTRFFAAYNLVCAPVVDAAEHLLGAVTVDDVLDHLLPDNWREEDSFAPAESGRDRP